MDSGWAMEPAGKGAASLLHLLLLLLAGLRFRGIKHRGLDHFFADAVEGRAPFLVSMEQMLDTIGAFEAVITSFEKKIPVEFGQRVDS